MRDLLDFGMEEGAHLVGSIDQGPPAQADPTANALLLAFNNMGLREYDGDERNQSLHAFLESIERVRFSRPNITEKDLVNYAMGKCSGHAYRVLKDAKDSITTMAQLKDALLLGCGVYDNPEIHEYQLATCKQEKGEGVAAFYRRLCKIQQCYENSREALQETEDQRKARQDEDKAKYLKRGLRAPIKDEVRRQGLKTTAAILKFALQEEIFGSAGPATAEDIVAAIVPALKTMLPRGEAAPNDQFDAAAIAAIQQPRAQAPWQTKLPASQQLQQAQFPSYAQNGAPLQQALLPGYAQNSVPPQLAPLPGYPQNGFQQQQLQGRGYAPVWQAPGQQTYGGQWQQQGMGQSRGRGTRAGVVCFACNKPGHYKSQCKARYPCAYCGQKGHGVNSCPHVPCTQCKATGHPLKACPANAMMQQQQTQTKNLQ